MILGALLLIGGGQWWQASSFCLPKKTSFAPQNQMPSSLVPAGESEEDIFPAKTFPEHLSESLIDVSLALLAKNGADLSRPLPSVHRVVAASRSAAEGMCSWGREQGFTPRPLEIYHEHGGVERYAVELVKTELPRAARIHADCRKIFAATQARAGVFYQTWQGEIIR